jgi:hypothetical protein
MGVDHFVGRQDAVRRLAAVLTGRERADGKLTIQSIEGPGGIGKTCLFNHVLATSDLADRNYLSLRIDGNDPAAGSVVRAVARMVDSAEAEAIRGKPPGYYFPTVDRTTKAIETIRSEAVAEFKMRQPNNEDGRSALLRFLDLTIALGKRLNDVFPVTKKYVNVREVERDKRLLEEVVPTLVSLREESAWFWERLGLGGSTALRNAVKENALRPIADALVSDLSAILKQYRSEDANRLAHSKIKGIDRLLLVFDDYEMLQEPLGEFLVGHLLPALRAASFQSTVIILGRDQLEATHPAWDQHLKGNVLKRITLDPLSRTEMDQLVESFGVRSPDEKERAWRDTQGYPFYVQLWIEEAESGGRGAVMLKRFHDRTTRWMGDREKRWLQHTLFLTEVNKRTLRTMLGSEAEADEAFRWFEREGSVRDTAGSSFRVREYLRSRLVDYLRASDPDRCEELERRGRSV